MSELPDVAELLRPLLERVTRERRPLLIALAERMAAERYREWARDDPAHESELLACAAREEEIATRIEALFKDAETIQREILEKNPELRDVSRTIFAGRPVAQQFTIQAQGERLGAATWRAFARDAESPDARETFLACADLEEASAVVLDEIVGERA